MLPKALCQFDILKETVPKSSFFGDFDLFAFRVQPNTLKL